MPPRSSKPAIPQVPNEMWSALYRAADELRGLALWECMGDSELLGIDDPRTGGPMLGAVMGGLGEVFGLAIYHGEDGCRVLLQTALGESDDPTSDLLHRAAVLKVEFVPKRELPPEDKRRVKQLGFQPAIKSPQWWPLFESMRPGYLPWRLDEEDATLLLHALPRLTALGRCVRPFFEGDESLPADGFAFWPKGRAPGEPLRPEEVEWRRVEIPPERMPEPFAVDEVTAARLALLPQDRALTLEVDACTGLAAIGEKERPWFMKLGLAADARTGMIAGTAMGESAADTIENIAGRALVTAASTIGARPAKVQIRREGIAHALAPLAGRLGIKLEQRRTLPMVEEAMAAVGGQFGIGPGMA